MTLLYLKVRRFADFMTARKLDQTDRLLHYYIALYWHAKLYKPAPELSEASKQLLPHRKVFDPNRLVTGSNFIYVFKTAINALPTRARTARVLAKEQLSRTGCSDLIETLSHV